MGILSKLFGKKSIDSLKEFEVEIAKLKEKSDCEFVAITGIGGRLKGLPLVYQADDEKTLKRYSARLIEVLNSIKTVTEEKPLDRFVIYYGGNALVFHPLTNDVAFTAITKNMSDLPIMLQWYNKNAPVLIDLFNEKSE